MNTLQIEYFFALAENLSFKKTTGALYVSQPAVSMQISALEKEWGFKLFTRSYRDVTLTAGGKMMYNLLKQAALDFETTLAAARIAESDCKPIFAGRRTGIHRYAYHLFRPVKISGDAPGPLSVCGNCPAFRADIGAAKQPSL